MYVHKRIWFLILAALLLCAACRPRITNDKGWPVVREITVTCEQGGNVTRQVYTTQWKMREILNCIRSLGQKFTPFTDPDALPGRIYSITLTHTDGSQRIYQTKADCYIRTCRDPWQQADPQKISDLHLLLQSLPGDDSSPGKRQDIPRHY